MNKRVSAPHSLYSQSQVAEAKAHGMEEVWVPPGAPSRRGGQLARWCGLKLLLLNWLSKTKK